jgi:hypothetical protein
VAARLAAVPRADPLALVTESPFWRGTELPPRVLLRLADDGFEIVPRGEAGAGSGKDDDPHPFVGPGAHRVVEREDQGAVLRVAHLRAVHGDARDGAQPLRGDDGSAHRHGGGP